MIDEQMSWKENLKLLVFTLLAVSIIGVFYSIGFGDDITGYVVFNDSSDCGSYVNEDSMLSGDMSCNGTGMIINASNVVLDCAGYTINYSTAGVFGYGINNSGGYDNVTIKNCNIVEGNSTTNNKYGIYFSNADDGTIENNNITTSGEYGVGIHFASSSDSNTLLNNTITTSGPGGYGISFSSSSDSNTLLNNTITTSGPGGYGIYSYSSNSNITDNTITTSGEYGYGIYSYSSNLNTLLNNTITTSGEYGYGISFDSSSDSNVTSNTITTNGGDSDTLYLLRNSNNNLFQNNNITQSGRDGIRLDVSLSDYPENNNFTNNTFSNIADYDLNIVDDGINGTYLIDQVITNYYIAGSGGIIYFKDTDEGEIRFIEPINGTGTNLSNDVQISNNLIEVNSSQTGLNRSANLTFYNINLTDLGISNPTYYRNGYLCSDSICSSFSNVSDTYYFNVESFTNYSIGQNSSCNQEITESTTLEENLTCPGTAINIGADDIILDCDGHTINYSTAGVFGYGINNSGGYDNVTIKNCNIVEGNSTTNNKYGIYFSNADDGTIENNNITTEGNSGHGIYSYSSNLNTLLNNTITTSGEYGYGISFDSSSDSNVTSNTITTNGGDSDTLYLLRNSNNNLFQNNNITQSGRDGIRLDVSLSDYPENNNFTNNTFSNIADYDLNIVDDGINGTYLIDQVITNYYIAGSGGIIYFKDTDEGEIRFTESINGTGTNLSADVQISANLIEVDSVSNSGLNKSANLSFYNVSISGSAYPFKDGTFCPSGDCTEFVESGNNYSYTVNGFSNYSVGDACGQEITESTNLSYDITGCINDYIINITADDVVFDCGGRTIQGNGSYGIYVNGQDNVTVQNCNINMSSAISDRGIYFNSVNNGTIFNNNVSIGRNGGVYLVSSSGNNVSGNNVSAGDYGVYLGSSSGNVVSDNDVSVASYGVSLSFSDNNNVSGNVVSAGDDRGVYLSYSDNNNVSGNNISAGDDYGVYLSSSSGNVVFGNVVSAGDYQGVSLSYYCDNNNVSGNVVSADRYGVYLSYYCVNNVLLNNNISVTTSDLIYDDMGGSYYNTLIYNNSDAEVKWNSTDLSIIEFGTLYFGSGLDITENNIFVNSSMFSGLNQSANLSFYNVSISGSAVPYRNGDDCGGFCGSISNVGDDYFFSVTGFTTYSVGDYVAETEEETSSGRTTTGGGGISANKNYNIEMGYLGFEYSGVDMEELFKIVIKEALYRLLNGGSGDTIGRVEQSLAVRDTIELNLMVMKLIDLNKWVRKNDVLYVREGVLISDAVKDMVDAFSAGVIEIKLGGVGEGSVTVLVDNKTATIRLGESVGFDVNRDRVNEFNLKLESIVEDVVILEVVQKVPAVGLVENMEEEGGASEEEKITVKGDGEKPSSNESSRGDLTGEAYMFNQMDGEGVALFSYLVVLMIIVVSMLLSHGLSRVVVAIPGKKKIERELSLLLKDAPEGSGFVLKDGRKIRNIEAIVFELMNMGKEEFNGYVNWSKNDIAEWINYVFRESELAETLRSEKDKERIAILLYESLRNVKK